MQTEAIIPPRPNFPRHLCVIKTHSFFDDFMYPELRTSVSADEREHLVLQHWKTHDIFRRSIGERASAPVFSFFEGPPTVNGMPGIHHVWSRTIKDTICRYKTMRGYRVERKGGWDTHGLPGVRSYSVERSDIKGDNFTEIGTVLATGSNSTYHYRDANFSSIQQAGTGNAPVPMSDLYKYRLKLVYDNAISYSQQISVSRPAASVKRTWGMIKEMFR